MNNQFLEPPRWPGGPQICSFANLPAFDTEAAAMKFHNQTGAEHPLPILRQWQCAKCGGWHYWVTAPTDSNGAFKGGAADVPVRVEMLTLGLDGRKLSAFDRTGD